MYSIVYHIDCTGRKYTLIADLNLISHNIHEDRDFVAGKKRCFFILANVNDVNSIDTGNFS